MKRFLLVSFLLGLISFGAKSQVTVFSDDFNTSQGASYTPGPSNIGTSPNWYFVCDPGPLDWGARIHGNVLDMTNDATAAANVIGSGNAFTPTNLFASPYNTTLALNTGLVTWTFNMRQIRTDPAGFNSGNYGVAFVLGSQSNVFSVGGSGYAVVLGNTGSTDPVRLVKFNPGVTTVGAAAPPTANDIIVSNTAGLTDFGNEYLSVKVTYDPSSNTWELFLRNDGTIAFADPAVGSLTSQGTAVDNTYTGAVLGFLGGYWQGSTGVAQTAFFDNVKVTVGAVANTITVGTVSTLTFNIDCFTSSNATVDFTSTGTFSSPNNYVAQLSDAAGSFASPTVIGSLSSTANSGTINITIPAATPTGAGYLIRIVSDNPNVTSGNTSLAITINLSGTCTSNAIDYFRSKTTGNWNSTSTWESSVTGTAGTWVNATLTPTNAANTIRIRNSHSVTANVAVTVDQVIIENGGTLINQMPAANTFTIANGTSDDIEIQNGGMYHILSTQGYSNYQAINAGATIRIKTGGIIRLGDGTVFAGSSNHLLATTSVSYIWENASIFEWNSSGSFTSSGVTFFPDADALTIPVFRTTQNIGSVGASAITAFNSVFEANGNITFVNSGTKTFRNGIRGTGTINGSTSGKFIINGLTGELGGTGGLTVPAAIPLEVGSSANTTTVTLISDKTITGSITLINANNTFIDLGANDLTVSGTVLPETVGSTNSYIRTDANGGLLTLNNITTSKTFPIGETTYNPLVISSGSGNNFSARVRTGIFDPNGAIPTDAVNRTWYIMASAVTPGVTVTYQYSNNAGELTGTAVTQPANMELLQSDYITWSLSVGNTSIVSTPGPPYTVTTTTAIPINNSLVPYALGVTGTMFLPVDCIISTKAQKRNNTGIISWTVNTCADVTSFEVQRSVGNGAYQTIGTINPSVSQTDFNFTDPLLAKGVNLYRIKVKGLSGSIKYSNTVALIYESDALLITSVVPNPVHSAATLTLSAAKQGNADLTIYNMAGIPVKQWHSKFAEGNNTIQVNVTELPAGVYQLVVSTERSKTVTRFIKQ